MWIKSSSALHNFADTEVRKRIKTITGCSRFIEEQNVISANIMRTEKTGEKTVVVVVFICSSMKILQKQTFIVLISEMLNALIA